MNEVIQNLSAEAWAAIIAFLTTYGGTMVAFLISWIRTRIKNIDLEKTVEEMQEFCNVKLMEQSTKYQKHIDERLERMEKAVMNKISDNEDQREIAINTAAGEFEDALNELKSTSKED